MSVRKKTHELEVDFIGGVELTPKEEVQLQEYFAKKGKKGRLPKKDRAKPEKTA